MSTTNALGGKNYFLAICYLTVGSICVVFAGSLPTFEASSGRAVAVDSLTLDIVCQDQSEK